MSANYVQRLSKDPYIHNVKQEEIYLGGVGQETPGDAMKLVTQGKKMYTLYYANGVWNLSRNDGTPAAVVTGNYDPDFRVRYFSCHCSVQVATYFYMIFDTPQSVAVNSYWALGVMHKMWVTRIYLSDDALTHGEISLIG